MGKHLAPEATGAAAVASAVHRALARAKGRHGRRRGAPGPIVPTALLGLDDVDVDSLDETHRELDKARGWTR